MEVLVPLGLILHELLSNAMKYAFASNARGTINIIIKKNTTKYILIVKDNGKGLPENIDITKPETLGLSLVKMLNEQLGAELAVERKKGTIFTLTFPYRI